MPWRKKPMLPSPLRTLVLASALLACVPPPSAIAQTPAAPQAICKQLTDAISYSEKLISYIGRDNATDQSAPRVTMRHAEATNEYAKIGVNVQLLAAHRCPPYPNPINPSAYTLHSIECSISESKRQTALLQLPRDADPRALARAPLPECDLSTWTRKGD